MFTPESCFGIVHASTDTTLGNECRLLGIGAFSQASLLTQRLFCLDVAQFLRHKCCEEVLLLSCFCPVLVC